MFHVVDGPHMLFELSNQALITCMSRSLCLGVTVPVSHTRVLQQSAEYAHIDVLTLADSAHTSRLLHTSRNGPGLAFDLSNVASSACLASIGLQPDGPVAEEDTYSCGDIVTSVAGLSRSSTCRKLNYHHASVFTMCSNFSLRSFPDSWIPWFFPQLCCSVGPWFSSCPQRSGVLFQLASGRWILLQDCLLLGKNFFCEFATHWNNLVSMSARYLLILHACMSFFIVQPELS